ncbi:MAG: hypothetical protein ACLP1X_26185 [Polyangiaceae bacterium]
MGAVSVGRFAGLAPLAAFGGIALLALGCGSSSSTEAALDGGASSGGSSGTGSGRADAATACGDYYDAVYGGGCNGPILPAAELARQRARFVTECGSWLALSDVNLTAAAFESCAEQVQATDACRFNGAIPLCPELNATGSTGSRAAGAFCSAGLQCESGVCPYDGGYAASACGACASFVPPGQPCSGNVCASTADCLGSPAVCTPLTFGAAAGSICGEATFCGAGLYCSTTGVCALVGAQGAPCTSNEACAAHLDCVSGTCQPPGEVGAACPDGASCDPSLLCPNTTMQCTVITWASAGQPCGGDTLCLVGDCQTSNCPQVIPDGQPCTGEDLGPICDAFATCTNGVCALALSNACE